MIVYAIYGASGFGREVMPVARRMLEASGGRSHELVFVDDKPPGETLNGHRVLSYEAFITMPATKKFVCIAVANSLVRERISNRCLADGVQPFSVFAGNVELGDENAFSEGIVLCPFVTITSNTKIGKYFHANLYSYVAHDCVIGDYVTFAPGVKCNGNVVIEDHAYIGTGAVLRQGGVGEPLVIGRGAIVGMGAVVTKNVLPETTVTGVPARLLVKD